MHTASKIITANQRVFHCFIGHSHRRTKTYDAFSMPQFRNPKVLLLPLIAILAWSVFALHPSSASAGVLVDDGFRVVLTPLAGPRPLVVAPNWVLPIRQDFAVVHEFLRPTSDWGAGHRGIDFEVDPNQPLLAPHEGVVASSGLVFDVPTVVIAHSGSNSSVFQPACLDGAVSKGAHVSVGEPFGSYCASKRETLHCGALPCVHWSFRLDKGVYLNPLRMVGLLMQSELGSIGRVETSGLGKHF